jgi:Putative zinc dependent peptidase (DUF5700)
MQFSKRTFITFAVWLCSTIAYAQSVQIHFDYSNAEATLALLEAEKINDADFEKLLDLKSTKALIDKIDRRVPVDKTFYKSSMMDLKAGRTPEKDVFQWNMCLKRRAEIRKLFNEIKANEAVIKAKLTLQFRQYLRAGEKFEPTVHFLIGGFSAGFADDQGSQYVVLHRLEGELDGVRQMLEHELLHGVQAISYKSREDDLKKMTIPQKYVYEFAEALFKEGAATYLADATKYPKSTLFLKYEQDGHKKNRDRMTQNFILLDTLVYRLYRDSNVSFEDMYYLGFDSGWDNPMYYAGYEIAKTLAERNGKDGLIKYFRTHPIVFLREYLEQQKNPNAETLKIVKEIDQMLLKP